MIGLSTIVASAFLFNVASPPSSGEMPPACQLEVVSTKVSASKNEVTINLRSNYDAIIGIKKSKLPWENTNDAIFFLTKNGRDAFYNRFYAGGEDLFSYEIISVHPGEVFFGSANLNNIFAINNESVIQGETLFWRYELVVGGGTCILGGWADVT